MQVLLVKNPKHPAEVIEGAILTFVVPAPKGCNLNCAGCFIRQRKENGESTDLKPADYQLFIEEIYKEQHISALSIQGYEALLPESAEYTHTLFQTAKRLGLPISIVTNGTHLDQWADDLVKYGPQKISVSIDAGVPEIHNKFRDPLNQYQGPHESPFHATVQGLEAVMKIPALAPITSVTSILRPRRREDLETMPALLASLGIRSWIVNSYIHIPKNKMGGPSGEREEILENLVHLKKIADQHNVFMEADDEYSRILDEDELSDDERFKALKVKQLSNADNLYRLLPTGQCSTGDDVLRQIDDNTITWIPHKIHASDFIRSMKNNPEVLKRIVNRHLQMREAKAGEMLLKQQEPDKQLESAA